MSRSHEKLCPHESTVASLVTLVHESLAGQTPMSTLGQAPLGPPTRLAAQQPRRLVRISTTGKAGYNDCGDGIVIGQKITIQCFVTQHPQPVGVHLSLKVREQVARLRRYKDTP